MISSITHTYTVSISASRGVLRCMTAAADFHPDDVWINVQCGFFEMKLHSLLSTGDVAKVLYDHHLI